MICWGPTCAAPAFPFFAAESCDGESVACPADEMRPDSHVCRKKKSACDVEGAAPRGRDFRMMLRWTSLGWDAAPYQRAARPNARTHLLRLAHPCITHRHVCGHRPRLPYRRPQRPCQGGEREAQRAAACTAQGSRQQLPAQQHEGRWQERRSLAARSLTTRCTICPDPAQAFKCGKTCFLCGVKPTEMAFSKNTYCELQAAGQLRER